MSYQVQQWNGIQDKLTTALASNNPPDVIELGNTQSANPKFIPLYLPGQAWYVLASMIWDQGGNLAVKNGDKWQGALDTPQAIAGIRAYEQIYKAVSKAPADADEATPQQFEVFAKGNVGMMIALPWEVDSAIGANKDLKSKVGTFPIPSHTTGQTAPVFLGGSDLAIPAAA